MRWFGRDGREAQKVAEGSVPETARGCLLRTTSYERAMVTAAATVTRTTWSDGGAPCTGYRFPVWFLADNLDSDSCTCVLSLFYARLVHEREREGHVFYERNM